MKKRIAMVMALVVIMLVMLCVAVGAQPFTEWKPLGAAKWNVMDEVVAKNFAGHASRDGGFAESAYNGTVDSHTMTRLMSDHRMPPIDENIQYRTVQYESTSQGEQLLVPTVAWYDLVLREIKESSLASEQKYWCEIARIYELDAEGERIMDSLVVREGSELLDCQLESGKAYEAEVDFFNDYEMGFAQLLSLEIAIWNDGEIYLCVGNTGLGERATLDVQLTMDEAYDIVALSGDAERIVPDETYWIERKGEEDEYLWEIEERSSDELKVDYHLTGSVMIPETAAQTLVLRFQVE